MLRAIIDPVYQILDANESIVLNQVATIIDDGLARGLSVVKANGALLRVLAPALDIRGKPAQDGLVTRSENQRRSDEVRAEEQAKQEEAAAPAAGAGSTTTVTTQSPAPAATGGTATLGVAKRKAHRSRGKKTST